MIDVAASKEIHRVDLGPLWNPHGIVAEDVLSYFTAERAIRAYDPITNRLVWIMGTGQNHTHGLGFSNDGRTLMATKRGSDTVSIFELTATDPLSPDAWRQTIVPVCEAPDGIDISRDGREAWVGCRSSNEIGIVELAQRKMPSTFQRTRRLWRG